MLLAVTLCAAVLTIIGTAAMRPGSVTEASSERVYQLLSFIVGTVSGWRLGTEIKKPTPKDKESGAAACSCEHLRG